MSEHENTSLSDEQVAEFIERFHQETGHQILESNLPLMTDFLRSLASVVPKIECVIDIPTLKEVTSFAKQRGLYIAEEMRIDDCVLDGSMWLPRPLPLAILFQRHPSRGDILVSLAVHVSQSLLHGRTAVLELHVAQYCDDWQDMVLSLEPLGRMIAKVLGCQRIEIPEEVLKNMSIRKALSERGYRVVDTKRRRMVHSSLHECAD